MAYLVAEDKTFSNISATTSAFTLFGGNYAIEVVATWGGGNVALQRLAADGSSWVSVVAAWTANAYAQLNLPPGSYRFAVTTATGVYAELKTIPF